MSNKIDYISQMVHDTFSGVEDNILSFESPNATKGQIELNFNTHKVSFDKERSCFQMTIEDQVIEIPSNWGPFSETMINNSSNLNIIINQLNDENHFLKVLGHVGNTEIEAIQIFGPLEDLRMIIEPVTTAFAA